MPNPHSEEKQVASPRPELERLRKFVGLWSIEGRQLDGLLGAAKKVSGTETFEWLPGGYFLIHRLDGKLGDDPMACIEIIGYNSASGSYPVGTYYNNGIAHEWEWRIADEKGRKWLLEGNWELEGRTLRIRNTLIFSDDGRSMNGTWEYASDDAKWQTFWVVSSTKISS